MLFLFNKRAQLNERELKVCQMSENKWTNLWSSRYVSALYQRTVSIGIMKLSGSLVSLAIYRLQPSASFLSSEKVKNLLLRA